MKNKGITLVALVITIIILLILAGITLNLTLGQNGIITRAQEAGRNYMNAAEKEQIELAEFLKQTDNIITNTTGNIANEGTSGADKQKIEELEKQIAELQKTIEENSSTPYTTQEMTISQCNGGSSLYFPTLGCKKAKIVWRHRLDKGSASNVSCNRVSNTEYDVSTTSSFYVRFNSANYDTDGVFYFTVSLYN